MNILWIIVSRRARTDNGTDIYALSLELNLRCLFKVLLFVKGKFWREFQGVVVRATDKKLSVSQLVARPRIKPLEKHFVLYCSFLANKMSPQTRNGTRNLVNSFHDPEKITDG